MAFTLKQVLEDFIEVEERHSPLLTFEVWIEAKRIRWNRYMRDYRKQPDVRAKIIARMRLYNARPEVKARLKAWSKARREEKQQS